MFKLLLNCILIFILSSLTLITWTISANEIVNNYNKPSIDTIYRIVSNYNEKALKYNAISSKDKKAKQILLNDIKNYLIWSKDSYVIELNELKLKWYSLSNKPKAWWKFQLIPKLKIIDNWTELLRNMSDKETIKYVQEKIKWNLDLTNKVLWTKYTESSYWLIDMYGNLNWTAHYEVEEKIKKLTIGQANLYFDYEPKVTVTSKQTIWKIKLKESSIQKISEEFDFKVYEADVTAIDGDVVLEKIDLVQFGISDEGINIWELYKRDHNGNLLKLSSSRDERVYRYYKRDGNPGISFDLFNGADQGMKIRNWETVKFTIKVDSVGFSEWKDSQRTNIFYAKYKLRGQDMLVPWTVPQIIVYNICDEWVRISNNSILMTFDENFHRNLFNWLTREQIENYRKNWYIRTDYMNYTDNISQRNKEITTYESWLKWEYNKWLVSAYKDITIPWIFLGYESNISNQFKPINNMQCNNILSTAKKERSLFNSTYEEIKAKEEQKKVEQLSDRVSELEAFNAWCTIKGNINFDTGEKIYHIPWSRFYDETIINASYWERWFCTESDAMQAWWHKEQSY